MLMKRQDVVKATGLCYTTIYNMEKTGKFPSRRQVATGRVAWLRSEVETWVNNLAAVHTFTPDPLATFTLPDSLSF
jgi:prophage regulatory protein